MYDQLLNLVIQTPGLYILEEYYHDLLDYPEQLLNKYLEELKPLVGKQDITHYLKEIEEIPGGVQFISFKSIEKIRRFKRIKRVGRYNLSTLLVFLIP